MPIGVSVKIAASILFVAWSAPLSINFNGSFFVFLMSGWIIFDAAPSELVEKALRVSKEHDDDEHYCVRHCHRWHRTRRKQKSNIQVAFFLLCDVASLSPGRRPTVRQHAQPSERAARRARQTDDRLVLVSCPSAFRPRFRLSSSLILLSPPSASSPDVKYIDSKRAFCCYYIII